MTTTVTVAVANITYDLIRVPIQELYTYLETEGLQIAGPLPRPKGSPEPWPPILFCVPTAQPSTVSPFTVPPSHRPPSHRSPSHRPPPHRPPTEQAT